MEQITKKAPIDEPLPKKNKKNKKKNKNDFDKP